MPELYFQVRWPDGEVEDCYSPSTIIRESLEPGKIYGMDEFLARCRAGLSRASERVQAKYGMPCALASSQLARIETAAQRFATVENAEVAVLTITE